MSKMADSILNSLNEENLLNSKAETSSSFTSDCDTQTLERSLFNDPEVMYGRMTKAMTVALLIVCVITICINAGVIIRIYKLIKKGIDLKPAFYFIGNLAVSDFLVGLYGVIVFCIDLTTFSMDWRDKCCGLLTAIVVTACQETIATITLIAIDKYIFICHGLSYRSIVTDKRVAVTIVFSWLGSLLVGFLPAFGLHEDNWCACNFLLYISKGFAVMLLINAVLLPLIIITTLYSIILSIAIKMTRRKMYQRSKSSGGVSSVIRLSIRSKSSKSSNATLSSNLSSSSSKSKLSPSIEKEVVLSKAGSSASNSAVVASVRKTSSKHKAESGKSNIEADMQSPENTSLTPHSATNIHGCKTSSSPLVVELDEIDLSMPYETDSSGDSSYTTNDRKSKTGLRNPKVKFYDLVNPSQRSPSSTENDSSTSGVTLQSYIRYSEEGEKIEEPVNQYGETGDEEEQRKTLLGNENRERRAQSESEIEDINGEKKTRKAYWKSRSYYKKVVAETKDKVLFLQKCRAVKPIILIVFCFSVTYVPFITGAFIFKLQKDQNENLFKALNNLLYFAVVLNSLFNPFVYAYGYKEFRIRTKDFGGIFGRNKKRKKRNSI